MTAERMRALIRTGVGGPEVLSVAEVPVPAVRRGTLLVRVTAAGLNFHDVEVRRAGEAGKPLSAVTGSDVAGVVEQVGPGVDGFTVGQRVLGLVDGGAFAEYALVPAQFAAPVPPGLDDAWAACVPTAGLTALWLVQGFADPACESVVCSAAAGGVGHWLGGLLARHPARVVGVVSTEAKAEAAIKAGYDDAVLRAGLGGPESVRATKRAFGGRGVALVLDAVGGPGFCDGFDLLRPGGALVLFGRAAGPADPGGLGPALLDARRNLGLHTWFLTRSVSLRPREVAPSLAEAAGLLASGVVRLPVTRLPLAAATEAHALLEARRTIGKVVLSP